jgi:signal transduction histidine kinase
MAEALVAELSAALAVAERRRAESESLREVTGALLAQRKLDDVLELVAATTQHLIGAQRSMVFLLGDDEHLHAALRRDSPQDRHPAIPVAGSRIGRAVQHGRPTIAQMRLADLQPPGAETAPGTPEFDGDGEVALLAVPLKVDGVVIGVLTAVDRAPAFSDDDVRIVSIFADQAAVAIKQAHLARQVESLAIWEERQRLARELHDAVTQTIYSITLFTEAGRQMLAAGSTAQAEHYLNRIGDMSLQALKELRLLIYELRPPILAREGLVAALRQRLAAVEERAGIRTRLLADPLLLPAAHEDALFRIAQEALNNALKHAHAAEIAVQIRGVMWEHRPAVSLVIRDDGCGWEPAARTHGGLGILSMQERAAQLGGVCEVVAQPDAGVTVTATIPLP